MDKTPVDEAPDSQDAPTEEPSSAFESLSEEAQQGLRDCLKHALEEDRTDRRDEVSKAWHLRLYCKRASASLLGQQNLLLSEPC